MTLIEIKPHPGAGKFLKRQALSLCSRRKGSRLIGSVGTSIEVTHL
jgi:hypothetical protein